MPVGNDGFFFCPAHSVNKTYGGITMNDKRTLEKLRNEFEGHIYLRLHSKEEYEDSLVRAESEGFRLGEHQPTEYIGGWRDMLALCEDKLLGFCNTFTRMVYAIGAPNVHRIDYAKYIGGEEVYII